MALDFSYLQEITGDEPEIMKEMLDLFIRDIPTQLQNVRDFYNEGNLTSVGTEAHKLKPTLQYIGSNEMHEMIKQIEYSGKHQVDTDQIPEFLEKLFVLLEDALKELKEKRAALG